MQKAVGAAKASSNWDFTYLPGQIVGPSGGLLAMNVCMRVRIWSDVCFYYNMLPDSEVVGKETYCPHFLVTTEGIQKHPQVCDP